MKNVKMPQKRSITIYYYSTNSNITSTSRKLEQLVLKGLSLKCYPIGSWVKMFISLFS